MPSRIYRPCWLKWRPTQPVRAWLSPVGEMPVARLVPQPRAGGGRFDWAELHLWVSAPPVAGLTVAEMGERDLL
ncbi:MAG: hypothetical protein AW07_01445 [Candidatus Accumulibacter sp. SK-11]|nr:MAG: hypothetical protein AW07_01445 [Candidatus Accumulibacter sp. SK-11]